MLTIPTLVGPCLQQSENITFYVESGTAEQEEALRGRQYVFGSFMERLWAYLTIEQLLEQM